MTTRKTGLMRWSFSRVAHVFARQQSTLRDVRAAGNVFAFAGQGSQFVGMGKDLHAEFGSARLVFAPAPHTARLSLVTTAHLPPPRGLVLAPIGQAPAQEHGRVGSQSHRKPSEGSDARACSSAAFLALISSSLAARRCSISSLIDRSCEGEAPFAAR